MNKCYLLVQKGTKLVIAVYLNESTAIQSKMKLNKEFGIELYIVLKKRLFTN